MGRFHEGLPSPQGWLHELAQTEIHPDAEKLLQLGKSFDPQQLVEESSIQFLSELRETLTEYARIFNAYSETGTRFQEVKVYGIAQSGADFMLFRNQIKLIFSNQVGGMIQITFAQHSRGTLAVDGQDQSNSSELNSLTQQGIHSQEIMAQVGPFRDVFWTFQGEKVSPEQVGKFYFSEFARLTRDVQKSKRGNQLLIDQIKALLQQKGLDL